MHFTAGPHAFHFLLWDVLEGMRKEASHFQPSAGSAPKLLCLSPLGFSPLLLNLSESTLTHELSLLSGALACPEVPCVGGGAPVSQPLTQEPGSAPSAQGPQTGWHLLAASTCVFHGGVTLRPRSSRKLLSNVSPSARAMSFSDGLHGKNKPTKKNRALLG